MRIGQKTDIEYEVGILGYPVPEAEAYAGDKNALIGFLFLKAPCDVGTQFVNIKFGSVDNQVSDGPNITQMSALGSQGRFHRSISTQWMWTAGLAIPPKQDSVGSLEEDHFG